ncbi:sodium-coupled neutral amino acid transporter 7-like [Rhopilema esculentum]|uniref:sodium-coupled neutral amino acid transporter 7-like n=1 Tax=Rhopilema esculentum TaxID=499914 RepID=UPI0031D0A9D2|eukprot:gene1301-15689_t
MFDARDSHEKNSSNYRYVPINTPTKFEDSIGFESSGKATSTGLPDMDFEEEDCLPPLPSNYGTFSRKNSRMRAVISRLPDGTVPPYRAVFLVTNAAFGAGILNIPQAYMNAGGLQTAITVQVILLIFVIGAFLIVARCAGKSEASTYQDVVLFMCGPKAKMIVQVLIIIYFFGSCITYLIIIGEQASKVLTFALNIKTDPPWYTDRRFLMGIISCTFILPLCIPRRLAVLSYSSFFGGIGALYITGMIVYKYFATGFTAAAIHDHSKDNRQANVTSAMAAIPVICFGYQCHVSSVAVYADLKNRSMKRFFLVCVAAMVVCTTAYSLCGVFGYLSFGMDTNSDILLNYGADDLPANIARAMIVLIIFSSFAIITFCARTAIEDIVLKWWGLGPDEAERHEKSRRLVETIAWFALTLILAAVIPDIGVAISLIGGIAALFIFVFPGLCLLQSVNIGLRLLTWKEKTLVLIACVYIVVGVFIFGENTALALGKDIKIDGRSLF